MRFNPIIGSDLAGHVGGLVASHNTYGVYFKRRVHPVQPRSAGQVAQRAALQYVSQSWRALDPYVQETWKSVQIVKKSRKGFIVTLTGQGAYMYVNLLRQRIGLTLIGTPPLDPDAVLFTVPSVSLVVPTTASVTFESTDGWNAADGGVIVSVAGPLSPGVSFTNAFRTVGVATFPGAVPKDFTLPFAIASGDRVRFRYHASDPTGRQSQVVTQDVTAP